MRQWRLMQLMIGIAILALPLAGYVFLSRVFSHDPWEVVAMLAWVLLFAVLPPITGFALAWWITGTEEGKG